jgi:hypothetical protein
MRSAFPWLRHVFADAGYAGEKLRQALAKLGQWTLDILEMDTTPGFFENPAVRIVYLAVGNEAQARAQPLPRQTGPNTSVRLILPPWMA